MGKILVIDDDPSIRDLVKYILEKEGHQIFLAENGAEGVELFEQEEPQLVLLDLQMPVMDGFEFLKHIEPSPDAPFLVIILTGCDDDENIRESFDLGACIFMRKPLETAEVSRVVNKALELLQKHLKGDV